MSVHDLDPQEAAQEAVVILENTLRGQGEGTDKNLLIAIEILRNHKPTVSVSNPVPREPAKLEQHIVKVWNQSLDPQVKDHAQPTGLRRGTLFVSVDSRVWLTEIVRYHRKQILTRLQQELGSETIQKMSFRFDETSTEIHFQFSLPESLLRLSSAPQTPCHFNRDQPPSAQGCVRWALRDAAEPNRLEVSFRHDSSQTPRPNDPPKQAEEPPPPPRSISKRLQFKILERADFTCSRCGRKAPEVLLHVHEAETPTREGSTYLDHFVALCTACQVVASPPQSAAEEAPSKLSELELRKEQLEMMIDLERLSEHWSEVVPTYCLTEEGKRGLNELTSRFTAEEIAAGMEVAARQYLKYEDGRPTKESVEIVWSKVGGICFETQVQERYPYRKRIYSIRANILKHKFPALDEQEAFDLMKQAAELNADLDSLECHSRSAHTYDAWRSALKAFIADNSAKPRQSVDRHKIDQP